MLRCVEEDGPKNQLCYDGGSMPDTLLSSLSSTLKLTTREEIARSLGESEQAVSRGLEFATAAVFDALHRQTGQSDMDAAFLHLVRGESVP